MRANKKLLFEVLDEYFLPRGYRFNSEFGQGYFNETNLCVYKLSFNFKTRSSKHVNSSVSIHFRNVEKVVKKVGAPNRSADFDLNNNTFLSSIQDKECGRSYAEQRLQIDLSEDKGILEWANLIKKYMLECGEVFLTKYSHLPNVLLKLNQLEDEGEVSYTKIMVGGLDHLFRVLIISKLCDDSRYTSKIERFDEIFSRDAYEDWVPYYNDLKSKLETIDPIYTNIDVS